MLGVGCWMLGDDDMRDWMLGVGCWWCVGGECWVLGDECWVL